MSTTMHISEEGVVKLVEETELTQIGNFAYEYNSDFLRDEYIVTPKHNCDLDKFITEALLIQSRLSHRDVQVVIERFALPKPKGPAW